MSKEFILLMLLVPMIAGTSAYADRLAGLSDVTVVDGAIVSLRYEGVEYVVADGDLSLGTTTRWYVVGGVEMLWAEGDPVPPEAPTVPNPSSNAKIGDVGSNADNFFFSIPGDPENISSIDGINFQETVFPFLTRIIFVFERNGNDNGTVQAILADGSLGTAMTLTANGAPYASTGINVNGQTAYGYVVITDVPVQGVRITAEGHDTLSISAPTPLPVLASLPNPTDGATDVPRDAILSWTPGIFAPPVSGHRVYLSNNFGDANDAIGATAQDANSYTPAQRLEFNTMYYWRVDEVNAPPDSTVFKGNVWSFTTEPLGYPIDGANITATASSTGQADFGPEKTIDGSGLDENDLHSIEPTDMWLSGDEPQGAWIQYEFDSIYKLYQMWVWNSNQIFEGLFGFGIKDVTVEYSTNGTDWMAVADVPEFARAPGAVGYAHDTTVDFGGAVAKYVKLTATSNWGGILAQFGLSEVRFFSIPVSAREPSPDAGAVDVNPAVTLSWRAGREAATHDVYLSSDQQAVIDGTAPAVSVTDASYSSDVDLAGTYYWRIDEVNDAETPTTWQGDVWSFSTPDYLVVDDFESYNDIDPPDPESHRVFESWSDGFGVATNGALVGNDFPPYLETTIVHGGAQSLPLFYSNTGGAASSETTRTFTPGQDWTKHGIETLVLYFQGIPGNTGQLYLKVNGVKVPYPGDAANIARLIWTQWTIDLASLGVNLQSITSLAIGIDGNGAAGTLYIDDIVLYRLAPPAPTAQIYLEAEAGSITAPMTVRTDPLAAGGSYIGTDDGSGDENNAPPATGVATYNFTSQGGVYTISLRVIITGGSNSFWVRIPGATNYAPGTHTSGWIRFNDISDGADWHWDEVHSSDHNNEVVHITVPAGPQTLEIARREDGTLLDAIVISKID